MRLSAFTAAAFLAAQPAFACIIAAPMDLTEITAADAIVTGEIVAFEAAIGQAELSIMVDAVLAGEFDLPEDGPLPVIWGSWTNNGPPEQARMVPVLAALVTAEPPSNAGLIPPGPDGRPALYHPACTEAFIFDGDSDLARDLAEAIALPADQQAAALAQLEAPDWGAVATWLAE